MRGEQRGLARVLGRFPRLGLLAFAGAVLAFGLVLHRFWLRELSHLTGDASWIWITDSLERVFPVAGLFVAPLHLEAPAREALPISSSMARPGSDWRINCSPTRMASIPRPLR